MTRTRNKETMEKAIKVKEMDIKVSKVDIKEEEGTKVDIMVVVFEEDVSVEAWNKVIFV
jgi:hypothetical protein